VAIPLELCEGICVVMWCLLCTSKKSWSSLTWSPLVIANPYMAMVLNLHELYHESYTFWIIRLHFCNGWLLDKDGSILFSNKIIIGEKASKLFFDHVFWYHGLYEYIIFFNHEPQFVAKFWKRFFELLGVKVKLLSFFHPWMDGQMEWVNQVLEQYLCYTTNYHQYN
jgi:hypothetical protein